MCSIAWGLSQVSADQWVLGGSSVTQWGDIVQVRAQIDESRIRVQSRLEGLHPKTTLSRRFAGLW